MLLLETAIYAIKTYCDIKCVVKKEQHKLRKHALEFTEARITPFE